MVRVTRDARRAALNRKHERRQDFMWQRDVRIADANSLAILKDGEKADIEREKLSEKLESIVQRAALDAQRAVAERDKAWSAEEKRILSQPRTVRTGGVGGSGANLVHSLARSTSRRTRYTARSLHFRCGASVRVEARWRDQRVT